MDRSVLTANARTVVELYEAFNGRDLDAAVRNVADDAILVDQPTGETHRGREGIRAMLQQWADGFSDGRIEILAVHDAGDTVTVRFVGRGTHDGPFGGIPATGKPVEVAFCDVNHLNADGLIVAGESYYDLLTMLRQIGLAPELPQP